MCTRVVNIRVEPCDIYIARPSKWGNPFIIGRDGDRNTVIKLYRQWILNQPHLLSELSTLKGKRLGCFCKPNSCHGDILVSLIEEMSCKD